MLIINTQKYIEDKGVDDQDCNAWARNAKNQNQSINSQLIIFDVGPYHS